MSAPRILGWSDINYSVGVSVKRGCFSRTQHKRKPVLHKISGRVNTGEMCALMGPSGSGKTSLLSVLAGRLPDVGRVDNGTVLFDGQTPDKSFQRLCGFVFQDDLLMAALTVRETVEFARKCCSMVDIVLFLSTRA